MDAMADCLSHQETSLGEAKRLHPTAQGGEWACRDSVFVHDRSCFRESFCFHGSSHVGDYIAQEALSCRNSRYTPQDQLPKPHKRC